MPAPATEGSKVPKAGSVIPAPDQVPLGSVAVRLTAMLLSQNGGTADIVASRKAFTITSYVLTSGQLPPIL